MRTSNFLSTVEGSKYLLCDGSEIPSSYTKLRSLMTHTPDLRDRVPQGVGTYAVNTYIKPAIPNIVGELNQMQTRLLGNRKISGAFIGTTHVSGYLWTGSMSEANIVINFDASNCSQIYKNDCTTVQPPALAVNFYIKAK